MLPCSENRVFDNCSVACHRRTRCEWGEMTARRRADLWCRGGRVGVKRRIYCEVSLGGVFLDALKTIREDEGTDADRKEGVGETEVKEREEEGAGLVTGHIIRELAVKSGQEGIIEALIPLPPSHCHFLLCPVPSLHPLNGSSPTAIHPFHSLHHHTRQSQSPHPTRARKMKRWTRVEGSTWK